MFIHNLRVKLQMSIYHTVSDGRHEMAWGVVRPIRIYTLVKNPGRDLRVTAAAGAGPDLFPPAKTPVSLVYDIPCVFTLFAGAPRRWFKV